MDPVGDVLMDLIYADPDLRSHHTLSESRHPQDG